MSRVSIFIILLICLVIAALVLVLVYRDAKKRNMNALLWGLLAVLAPFFLGLIVYLICRNPIADLQCPRCGTGISATDRACPNCNYPLLTQCPDCNFPVQRGWKNCPKCGKEFPNDFGQPVRAYKKDNSLAVLIIVVVLIVLALSLVAIPLGKLYFSRHYISKGYAGYEGMYNITAEDMAENEAIASWLEYCKQSDKDAYVLLSESSSTCLVYVANCDTLLESNLSLSYYSDDDSESCLVEIYIEDTPYEDRYGYDFFLYEFEILEDTRVEVRINGRSCDTAVTMTHADISWNSWGGQENE